MPKKQIKVEYSAPQKGNQKIAQIKDTTGSWFKKEFSTDIDAMNFCSQYTKGDVVDMEYEIKDYKGHATNFILGTPLVTESLKEPSTNGEVGKKALHQSIKDAIEVYSLVCKELEPITKDFTDELAVCKARHTVFINIMQRQY